MKDVGRRIYQSCDVGVEMTGNGFADPHSFPLSCSLVTFFPDPIPKIVTYFHSNPVPMTHFPFLPISIPRSYVAKNMQNITRSI